MNKKDIAKLFNAALREAVRLGRITRAKDVNGRYIYFAVKPF